MALISCPECGRQVSDAAAACPQCAYPISRSATAPIPPKGAPEPAAAAPAAPHQPPIAWGKVLGWLVALVVVPTVFVGVIYGGWRLAVSAVGEADTLEEEDMPGIEVRCLGVLTAYQCSVAHVHGTWPGRACWTVNMVCANGAQPSASVCQSVRVGGTATRTVPLSEFVGAEQCDYVVSQSIGRTEVTIAPESDFQPQGGPTPVVPPSPVAQPVAPPPPPVPAPGLDQNGNTQAGQDALDRLSEMSAELDRLRSPDNRRVLIAMGLGDLRWGQTRRATPILMEDRETSGCAAGILQVAVFEIDSGGLPGNVACSFDRERGLFEVVLRTDATVDAAVYFISQELGNPVQNGRSYRWDTGRERVTVVTSRGRTTVRAWHEDLQAQFTAAHDQACN